MASEDQRPEIKPSALRMNFAEPETTDALRSLILSRFANWLDQVLTEEKPIEGIAAELLAELTDGAGSGNAVPSDSHCDLYSTWTAMTALTQETKLQGRTFKRLSEKMGPVAALNQTMDRLLQEQGETISEVRRIADETLVERSARESELKREVRDRTRRELLGAMIEIRDRMAIGMHAASTSREKLDKKQHVSWFKRLFKTPATAENNLLDIANALRDGYRMGIERIDETLNQLAVSEIICKGKPFDPRTMQVVDIEETAEEPEGTVLEVYRTGYTIDTEVFQPAKVKVARGPSSNIE